MSWLQRISRAVFAIDLAPKPSAATAGHFPGRAVSDSSPRSGGPGADGPPSPGSVPGEGGHLDDYVKH